jgi:hypothetical protein
MNVMSIQPPTLALAVMPSVLRAAKIGRLMPLLLTMTAAHTFSHG